MPRGGLGRRLDRRFTAGALLAAVALVAAACSGGQSEAPAASASHSLPGNQAPSPAPVNLVVGLGYIPNVQFAPFYLAEQAGYYRDAGLQVEFENKIDPELVVLVGQGAVDVGISDGTSVIPAVSQGIPIRYAFTLYAQFPDVVFAKASSGITTAADLQGKKVGIPGKFGSNWIQLEALLASVGLTTADLQLVLFPDFGELAALQQSAVDAATGYANNEPVQLALSGVKTSVLALPPASQLPGPGLIVSAAALNGPKKNALRAFVAATQRAMRDIEADPATGVDATIAQVPTLATDRPAQLAVLEATIPLWESDYTRANGLGAVDPVLWERSIAFMAGLPDRLLAKPVTAADCTSSALLPAP
ncbi:MAG: ABC transporter substrate-binding protein [Candidatus Limnocylindrales bacterium]